MIVSWHDDTDATSEEFIPDVKKPVIVFMPEISKTYMGGTMRLGLRPTVFEPGTEESLARKLYAGAPTIWERHRHRYEVNPALVNELSVDGFNFIGKDEKGERMQILELESELMRLTAKEQEKLNILLILRTSILSWFPSAPRVLHTTIEPLATFPWVCRRCIRRKCLARTA